MAPTEVVDAMTMLMQHSSIVSDVPQDTPSPGDALAQNFEKQIMYCAVRGVDFVDGVATEFCRRHGMLHMLVLGTMRTPFHYRQLVYYEHVPNIGAVIGELENVPDDAVPTQKSVFSLQDAVHVLPREVHISLGYLRTPFNKNDIVRARDMNAVANLERSGTLAYFGIVLE